MALSVTHATVATSADAGNGDIHKAEWNAAHNVSGTLSADDVTDGTTNKAYTATEKTKLAGIASGATANSTDATLLARANHTGTQLAATISDFSTAADARVAAAVGVSVQAQDNTLAELAALSIATGDLIYGDGADSLARRAIGSTGNVLTVSGGVPTWAQPTVASFSSATPSGTAAVDVTNISKDAVYFGLSGVSHGDGTNRNLELYYSTNNGGAYTLWGTLLASAAGAAGAIYQGIFVMGLITGSALAIAPTNNNSASAVFVGNSRFGVVSAGAQINALRIQWATGVNFDAGTVYIKVTD